MKTKYYQGDNCPKCRKGELEYDDLDGALFCNNPDCDYFYYGED